MIRRTLLGAIVMTVLSATIAAGSNPYPRTFDLTPTLDPDCSSLTLSWTWASVAGESYLRYGITDSDGNSQGLYEATVFGSGFASGPRPMASAERAHRFKVVSYVYDAGGSVLLTGTNRFRLACDL